MMKTVLLILFIAAACVSTAAQDEALQFKMPPVPERAAAPEGFVPKDWRLLGKAAGDLNGDGRADAAVVAAHDAEGSGPEDVWEEPRLLVIALGEESGGLRLSVASDAVVLCRGCGGVFGDPFEAIDVERGTLVIRHYSGSRDRWGFIDRFRLQDGRWTHIGATERHTDTLDCSYFEERDANLITGLVIESGKMGRSSYNRTFYELRAALIERAPAVDGAASAGEWGDPHVVRLAAKEQVAVGTALWRGADDASARLSASWRGGELYLRAEVADDSVTPGDAVRLISKTGQVVRPVEMKSAPREGGYAVEARYTLKSLGLEELEAQIRELRGYAADKDISGDLPLRVSVEVIDEDAGQKTASVLSTSRGGRKYPARVRLTRHAGLPLLSDFDRESSGDVLPPPGFGVARP
ncbi:MAG TPA: hypothetical protein VF240_03755 [Pyrinomonadaceae bacterium]